MSRASHSPAIYKGIWVIIVCLFLFVPPALVYKMKSDKGQKDSSNRLSVPMASKSVLPPVVKIVGERVIEYKMYGRVVEVVKESSDGIAITFVLDADPVQTVIAGLILPQKKEYELNRYDANFEKKLAVDHISGAELVLQALTSSRSLEFGLIFPKVGRSADEESLVKDLDNIISGNWKSIPTKRLMISSIGVKAKI